MQEVRQPATKTKLLHRLFSIVKCFINRERDALFYANLHVSRANESCLFNFDVKASARLTSRWPFEFRRIQTSRRRMHPEHAYVRVIVGAHGGEFNADTRRRPFLPSITCDIAATQQNGSDGYIFRPRSENNLRTYGAHNTWWVPDRPMGVSNRGGNASIFYENLRTTTPKNQAQVQ